MARQVSIATGDETGVIEVTPFPLDGAESTPIALAETWLSSVERERASSFRFVVHRERYIRGRAMVRALLARRLGAEPGELVFEVGDRGKPHLAGSSLEFNLSHSEGRAALAIGDLPGIGIDLEVFDRRADFEGLARRCFGESEIAWMHSFPEAERHRAFFWVWTAKEARMKATGEGFSLEPKRIELAFSDGLPARCVAPSDPAAHLVTLPLPGAACTVIALAPFRVRPTEPPGWG